jgi:hypothetical protein
MRFTQFSSLAIAQLKTEGRTMLSAGKSATGPGWRQSGFFLRNYALDKASPLLYNQGRRKGIRP